MRQRRLGGTISCRSYGSECRRTASHAPRSRPRHRPPRPPASPAPPTGPRCDPRMGIGERTKAACSIRGNTLSATNLPFPCNSRRALAGGSTRPGSPWRHGRPSPLRPRRPRRRWPDTRCSGSSCRTDARGYHPAIGRRIFGRQFLRRQQHPRRAEPALQRVAPMKRLLQVSDHCRLRQPFDGFDRLPVRLHGKGQAAPHHPAFDHNRTRPADAMLASAMRSGQARRAQEIDKAQARFNLGGDGLSVQRQRDLHDSPPSRSTRVNRTRA